MKSVLSLFLINLLHAYAMAEAWRLPAEFSGESLLSQKPVTVVRADTNHKGLVMIFMSTKCPCSNSHVSVVKELALKHKDFRFVIVHSNFEESKTEAVAYFKNFTPGFEVIQDEKTMIADLLRAYKTPHAFVFNPEGKVVYRGGVTNSANAASADRGYLAEVLQDISEGKPARRNEGRTLGCVISREGEKNVF